MLKRTIARSFLLGALAAMTLPMASTMVYANDARGIQDTPPAKPLVFWNTPELAAYRTRLIRFNGPWAVTTFGQFKGQGGARAELIYAAAAGNDYVVDVPFGLRRSVQRWTWIRDRFKALSAEKDIDLGSHRVYYRTFSLSLRRQSCFVFMARWDVRGLDQLARAGKTAFGYFCAASGETLTQAKIGNLVRQMAFRDPDPRRSKPLEGNDRAALAFARRSVPKFPFNFGKTVREGSGRRRDN